MRTPNERAELTMLGIKRRFGKRTLEGRYNNPYLAHSNNVLGSAMFDYYDSLLKDLPNSLQGSLIKRED